MTKRIFSGMQPTGNLHLGNYLGALKNWVKLQDEYKCVYCVVDLHAITVPQDPKKLKDATRETAALYMAAGIDTDKSVLYPQSAVHEHTELCWILGSMTPLGWLDRMTQFKEKSAKGQEYLLHGLYSYPVLMAADILLYKATHVPVGEDQKQHLELTRDVAAAFNHRFEREYFKLPEPLIMGEATRVMSLRDGTKKMSKSDPSDLSRINITDDADTVAKKIQKAKTDPEPLPMDEKGFEGRPEAENLVGIYAALRRGKWQDKTVMTISLVGYSLPSFFIGLILRQTELAWLGIIVFSGGALFALATIPVELNASARARQLLVNAGIISGEDEQRGVNNVLNAAALTYVAGLITAVMQL
ncbi:MAG: tryptophan--tRNA ligase, partial [Alphaproteobacteria bacterium]|nr:tryptophan--tRNA ligase [Alphaproteobacteria bacterium]